MGKKQELSQKFKNLNRSRAMCRATEYIFRCFEEKKVYVPPKASIGVSEFRFLCGIHFSDLQVVENETPLSFFVRGLLVKYKADEVDLLKKLIAFYGGKGNKYWREPFTDADKAALRQAAKQYGWQWDSLKENIAGYGDLPF